MVVLELKRKMVLFIGGEAENAIILGVVSFLVLAFKTEIIHQDIVIFIF